MPDRERRYQPPYDDHLGDARRSGRAYSPRMTHADIDAALFMTVQGSVATPTPEVGAPPTPGQPETPGWGAHTPCTIDVDSIMVTPVVNGSELAVDVSWAAPTCGAPAVSYEVRIREDDPLEGLFGQSSYTTETNIHISGLKPATNYFVKVRASSATTTDGAWSAEVPFTSGVDTVPPPKVEGLEVAAGLRSLTISWTPQDDVDDVRWGNGEYEALIGKDLLFTVDVKQRRAAGGVVAFTDLEPGTGYYVRVRAIDSSGNAGEWSAVEYTETALAGTTDIAANAVTANKIQAGQITADKIAGAAVTADKIAANSITAAKLDTIILTVGKYITSANYVPGESGWYIAGSGTAELNNLFVRGSIITAMESDTGAYIRLGDNGANKNAMDFFSRSAAEAYPGRIQINKDTGLVQIRAGAAVGNSGYDDILLYPSFYPDYMTLRAKSGAGRLQIAADNINLTGEFIIMNGTTAWWSQSGEMRCMAGHSESTYAPVRGTSFIPTSDLALKTDVAAAEFDGLAAVRSATPSTFRYKPDPDREAWGSYLEAVTGTRVDEAHPGPQHLGFIAQDMPDLVRVEKDDAPDGYDLSATTAVLWKAVQELDARLEALEAA